MSQPPKLLRLPVRGPFTFDDEVQLYQCKARVRAQTQALSGSKTCEKLAVYSLNGTSLCELHAAQFALKWLCESSEASAT